MGLAEIVTAHHERAVVRVGDAYVKVETDPTKAEREHAILCAAPVPVPKVLWRRPGSPSLLALARVSGRVLTCSTAREDWVAAGRVVRTLHEAPLPAWEPWLVPGVVRTWLDTDRDWLLERALVDAHVVEAAHAIAVEVLTDRLVAPVLTHRDLQTAHVFVDDGRITAIIDWGDVGVGDGLYDVATLTGRHPDRLDAVLAGYGDVDRDIVRAWWAERFLGEPRWEVEHGFDPTESLDCLRSLVSA
jgi:aminoglycoside phosphotransferase (APT) family kinase protein